MALRTLADPLANPLSLSESRRVMDVVVRDGTPDDAPSLAVLKLAWANRHHVTDEESQSFVRDLASWMASQGDWSLTRFSGHLS